MTLPAKVVSEAVLARIEDLTNTGEIKLLGPDRDHPGVDAGYLRELSEIKRLLERRSADALFRAHLSADPRSAVRAMNLSIDPVGPESLWDEEAARRTPVDQISLAALRYKALLVEVRQRDDRGKRGSPASEPRYSAWRRRQILRLATELSPPVARRMPHLSCAIELCEGCSVGCWFCGVSAPRLTDVFRHNQENAAHFGGAIEALVEILGDFAGQGVCYWATDPFDNPDYERFIVDFHRLTGRFPQTTTALALRDLDRTRALLELSRRHGGEMDRFSVLTLKQLEQIHAAFTPEELFHVGLVMVNKESSRPKLASGRALLMKPRRGDADPARNGGVLIEGTGASVSGFLLNMVRRTVKLISPCLPNERWPNGYIVVDEDRFADTNDLRAILRRMVDVHMRLALRGDERVAFQ